MKKLLHYLSKAFGGLVGFLFLFAVCSLDSEGWWPVVLLVISGICLYVVAWHNGWMDDPEAEEAE